MVGAQKLAGGVARVWATLAISAAACLAFAWPWLADGMIYRRSFLEAGQLWRLWSGHLVHFSGSHLLLDTVIFAGGGVWLEWVAPRVARWFYLLAPAAISVILFTGEPRMEWYAGLSGMDVGVLVLLALWQMQPGTNEPRWFWMGVLLLVAAKVIIEATAGKSLVAEFAPGARVVPLAHLGGILCAAAAYLIARRWPWRARQ
jgi:rhomboid family GlyGly-CTERM serine protease